MAGYSRAEHEQGLARFLSPQHRPRFRKSLADPRLRLKLTNALHHFAWLDEHFVTLVPAGDPDDLTRQLHAEGAPPTCVVVGHDDDLDGRELPLEEALREVLYDSGGALISCVPGRLAVYIEEAPVREVSVLRRPS